MEEEIPILLDFDNIGTISDHIIENHLLGFRGYLIQTKLAWEMIDVHVSTKIEDYVLTDQKLPLTRKEILLMKLNRLKKVFCNIFNLKRNTVDVLNNGKENNDSEDTLNEDQPTPDKDKDTVKIYIKGYLSIL
jgi:hypothetical protein